MNSDDVILSIFGLLVLNGVYHIIKVAIEVMRPPKPTLKEKLTQHKSVKDFIAAI